MTIALIQIDVLELAVQKRVTTSKDVFEFADNTSLAISSIIVDRAWTKYQT